MRVNIRRGIFRLWLVMTVAWVVVVGTFLYSSVFDPWIRDRNYLYLVKDNVLPKGFNYSDALDFANATAPFYEIKYGEDLLRPTYDVIDFGNRVFLFARPDQKEELKPLSQTFWTKYSQPRATETRAARFEAAKTAAIAAFGPPTMLLLVGAALIWAFAGFSVREK